MNKRHHRALFNLLVFLLLCVIAGMTIGRLAGHVTPDFLGRLVILTVSALIVVPGVYWLSCLTWLR
jgi:hypothetical protein